MKNYLVATVKPWNIAAFDRRAATLPGSWQLVGDAEDLTVTLIESLRPRYVFFPHWSRRVPPEILERAECVCFHMTEVPYGRGGSPLQNLIARGHDSTVVSALRMVDELDAGPVYLKRPLGLDGRAQDIYERAAELCYDMMAEIIETEPSPIAQEGDVVTFERRRPEDSVLPASGSLTTPYDHIRMLDADTYPRAFADHGAFRLEFSHAVLEGDKLCARVEIRLRGEG